jgi:hypothetical protein
MIKERLQFQNITGTLIGKFFGSLRLNASFALNRGQFVDPALRPTIAAKRGNRRYPCNQGHDRPVPTGWQLLADYHCEVTRVELIDAPTAANHVPTQLLPRLAA